MEDRLGNALLPREEIRSPIATVVAYSRSDDTGSPPAVGAAETESSTEATDGANWPDESAELEYLSEARERGETVAVPKGKEEREEEVDAKALPTLNELVERIPPDVRDLLDDLFRAMFTTVRRIPRKALKDPVG